MDDAETVDPYVPDTEAFDDLECVAEEPRQTADRKTVSEDMVVCGQEPQLFLCGTTAPAVAQCHVGFRWPNAIAVYEPKDLFRPGDVKLEKPRGREVLDCVVCT